MPEVFVAKVSKFPDGERRIVSHAGCEIGVFHTCRDKNWRVA